MRQKIGERALPIGASGALLEGLEVGEELSVDVVDQVRPGARAGVVERAISLFRRGPYAPAMRCIDDRGMSAAFQRSTALALLLQIIQIFQEQNPGCLFDIVQLGRTSVLLAKGVVDILEDLFKH